MGNTADKLSYLEETKSQIKQAIINKGVSVSDSDTFRSYATRVGEIEGGGGDPVLTSTEKRTLSFNAIVAESIKSIDLTGFSFTSTSADGAFNGCVNLESIVFPDDIDTSKVTSMGNMFGYCNSLTSLDLSFFNTSKVTNMSSMFDSCSSLTSLDLSSFNTSKVTSMGSMFNGCKGLRSLNLSSFDTSKVTSAIMFNYCSHLSDVIWGNNWGSNSSLEIFYVNFVPLTHDSCLDLFNKLATRDNSPTLALSTTTKGYMSEEEIAIATGKGWTVA